MNAPIIVQVAATMGAVYLGIVITFLVSLLLDDYKGRAGERIWSYIDRVICLSCFIVVAVLMGAILIMELIIRPVFCR